MAFLRTPGMTGLDAAYEQCRRVHRRHDPTYYFATRRLPADVQSRRARAVRVRAHGRRARGRARRAADPGSGRAALDRCESASCVRPGGAPAPDRADRRARRRRRPPRPAARRARARTSPRCAIDCEPVRMQDWAELERYMQGSAGACARILAPLIGSPPERREAFVQPRARLPADELHPRRARGLGARPRLPAARGPRSLRRHARPDRPPRGDARLPQPAGAGGRARPRALPRRRRRAGESVTPQMRRGMLMARAGCLPRRARPRGAARLRRARPPRQPAALAPGRRARRRACGPARDTRPRCAARSAPRSTARTPTC